MKLITGLFFLLATQVAMAECSRPAAPQLPDGSSSDLEAMVEGQKAVKAYVAETEAYLDCLNEESAAAADEETPEQQLARIELHNEVVDDMEAVAAAFNEEIREYKAKSE
ncbi:MAG: hypothetical protein V2I66_05635 [Halieaceae bacterium]|jgi:hypothetical protein|nr:hypothetical protein [Halieaceae bacterium]